MTDPRLSVAALRELSIEILEMIPDLLGATPLEWPNEIEESNPIARDMIDAVTAKLQALVDRRAVPEEHDPLCSEGVRAGDQTMPCDCKGAVPEASDPAKASNERTTEEPTT